MATAAFHSFHTRRLSGRREEIERVFSIGVMERVWSKYIRAGLREQEIPDLHDYNDFHWDRKALFARLHNALSSGSYAPQKSTPVRVEKRYGVTRTLVLPAVEDCVVLQCIVEDMIPSALRKQPSRNSFFSRSHGFSSAPKFQFEKDYIWFRQWRKFSNVRLEFVSTHAYICVTDIANYFDNIDYSHLRNIVSTLHSAEEVTLDILFSVLDKVSWRPDYLPSPERSLPQVNFDAPRLLSHIYLYEVDAFLKSATGDRFVRWVDDMTMTTTSVAAGKALLRDLDQLLLTRGLRLNSGKTQILSAAQARRFFHEAENAFLDGVKDRLARYSIGSKRRLNLLMAVRHRFDQFRKLPPYGQAEKILRRYLTHFTSLQDDYAVKFAVLALPTEPVLREHILRYFSALGPRRETFRAISGYLKGQDALDDSSILQAVQAITEWQVRPNSVLHRDIRQLGIDIGSTTFVECNPFFFVGSLWLTSKYGLRRHITDLISLNYPVWSQSEFLARQVASTFGKFRGHRAGDQVRGLVEGLRFPFASAVFSSFDRIVASSTLRSEVSLYVLNGRNRTTYSIQRFLICLYVLTSSKLDPFARRALRTEVLKYVSDPLYVRVINSIKI